VRPTLDEIGKKELKKDLSAIRYAASMATLIMAIGCGLAWFPMGGLIFFSSPSEVDIIRVATWLPPSIMLTALGSYGIMRRMRKEARPQAAAMTTRLLYREKIHTYVLYRGIPLVLGPMFATGGYLTLISAALADDLYSSFWGFPLGGVICLVSGWFIARGFSRQWFRIYKEGFVPFWRDYFDSRPTAQTLIPLRNILFVGIIWIERIDGVRIHSDDFIIVKNNRGGISAYGVNPFSMKKYDSSSMGEVRKTTGADFEVLHFKAFDKFKNHLKKAGITPELVDWQSGEYEVPAMVT
jgi:hypothetical protein